MNPFATNVFVQTHIEDLHREAAERRLARQVPRSTTPIVSAWHASVAAVTAVTARVRAATQPVTVSTPQPACCQA